MRLQLIFELLLILLIIAFAAYGRVIERQHPRGIGHLKKKSIVDIAAISAKQVAEDANKHCVCNENICNCCREFHIPLVKLSGPGCASLQYLGENKLAMQLSIGENILTSSVINGKDAKPVCVALPGGFSKFCGKMYSIKRESDKQHFKACLGLELRSSTELEAALRVSCFRFGPEGLKLRPAEPLPPSVTEASTAADDDYDDFFGLDDDDDDDDDDEDDDYEKVSPENNNVVPDASQPDEQQETEEDDEDDFLGFGALFDIFTGDDEGTANKKKKPLVASPLPIIPLLSLTTTQAPKKPVTTFTQLNNAESSATKPIVTLDDQKNSTEELAAYDTTDDTIEITTYSDIVNDKMEDEESTTTVNDDFGETTAASKVIDNKIPDGPVVKVKKPTAVIKKKVPAAGTPKPLNNKVQQNSSNDDTEEEYDYGLQADDDDDEDEDSEETEESIEETSDDKDDDDDDDDEDEKVDGNKKQSAAQDEDDDDEEDEDDDDEEEEDAVLGALVSDGDEDDDKKDEKKKATKKKVADKNPPPSSNKVSGDKDGEDYDDLAALLTRDLKHPVQVKSEQQPVPVIRSARRSKDMRF